MSSGNRFLLKPILPLHGMRSFETEYFIDMQRGDTHAENGELFIGKCGKIDLLGYLSYVWRSIAFNKTFACRVGFRSHISHAFSITPCSINFLASIKTRRITVKNQIDLLFLIALWRSHCCEVITNFMLEGWNGSSLKLSALSFWNMKS